MISNQYSVFRRFASIVELLRLPVGALKQVCFLLVFLSIEHWILNTALAKGLGVHGVIYLIEEQDPLLLIHEKLKIIEESGELERRNLELQKKARASVERPKPVEGITKATQSRVFYYDPTYVVKEDLSDHQGQFPASTGTCFAKKGTRVNPLETVTLSEGLLFFDGDDEEQVSFAKEKLKAAPLKLILVKGAPLALSEDLKKAVYFDQGGILTKKLGIRHVPSLVTQTGLRLRIEEPPLEGAKK